MAIAYQESSRTFFLESKDVTYAFRVHEFGFLNHLYFGKKIPREDLRFSVCEKHRGHGAVLPNANRFQSLSIFQNECPTYGRGDYRESMVALCDADGVRIVDLTYESHKIVKEKPILEGMPFARGGETLIVELKDKRMGTLVRLFYTVYEDVPVIVRRMEIENASEKPFTIDRAYSFCVDYPDHRWEAISLPGAHLRERQMQRTKLSHGAFVLDSTCGVSSAQMNPFIGIVRKNTDENQGDAYGYNLAYSGNFVIKTYIEQNNELRVTGGINDYDFSWELQPKEKFSAPEAVLVYSDQGIGGMSRAFHDFYRKYLINERYVNASRPIVINNWEATYFDFDEEKLKTMIDSVVGTGIDTFVLDDGWFGERNNDTSGLGDWFVNEKKLPHGLKGIIDYTHRKGLKFGLWFEPEMVNENSDLYRLHPDWAVHAEGIKPCTGRDQYVLDLTRDDVCVYIIEAISKILRENEIDYVKWDMNRSITENYSLHLGKNGKEFHHRYVLGLYKICEAIVNGFPNVFFEGCASGGCRFDPAMLYYFPQIWTSDDSDAYMRTRIQYGTSICYPLSTQACHVSVCPNHQCGRVTPFSARADIAHLGATGYELDLGKINDAERAQIKGQVSAYKSMEDLILFGDVYRLNNPTEENLFAMMVVAKDKSKAHIAMMRPLCMPNDENIRIYPRGLEEDAVYQISELGIQKSGSTLMRLGIAVDLPPGDFYTNTYSLIKIET